MKAHGNFGTSSILTVFVVLAFALLVPVLANAQVTVYHARVTISGPGSTATYCDDGTVGCPHIWTFPGGSVSLAPGETLVLTQTALIPGLGGNFDTSERVRPTIPMHLPCNAASPCTTTIELDTTGTGFVTVYTNAANPLPGDELSFFNNDDETVTSNEASPLRNVGGGLGFLLDIGYADNVHGVSSPICRATGCLTSIFDGDGGTTRATRFFGAGINSLLGNFCVLHCFDAGVVLITATSLTGRMTGGGSIFLRDDTRVTHGFELHCNPSDVPNNLEINWAGGNNFHLTTLTAAWCIDNPAIAPPPPNAGFDTFIGRGVGTCNGDPATIEFVLTDAGEPGTKDTASYKITGACTLTAGPAYITKGNQQAHKK
jgi:hypothetical protein